jgi:molybdenum cofactor cytidylyltransferase
MSTFSAILLAAGESRRMGAVNKLALPINGMPLLRRSALMLLELGLTEIVVVSGYRAETTRELLRGLPVTLAHNPRYREGQMASVHRGLEMLQRDCDGIFVCLADQPLLEVDDLLSIRGAFGANPKKVLVPTFEGRRGNPIVLPNAQRGAILAGSRNLGCRRLIEKTPGLVQPFEMDNDHCVFDLDTPSAYMQYQARTQTQSQHTIAASLG